MPSIVTTDDTSLFYRDWGTGRPVVFVHSMLMSSQMWQHQMQYVVEHGFRAIAFDRRGHGRSDDPGTGYDFDTLADDLAAVLDGLELSDVTLVGHSMGGGEVIRYLTRHQARRVSRFALVGSTAPKLDVDPASGAALLETLRDDYGRWVMDNAAASFGAGLPGREIPQLEKDRTIQEWMSVSLQAAIECTAANIAADFRPEASRIRLPALVIHGDSDVFAPLESCGRRSADLIPDSKLVVYPNGSHMLQLSHRQQLNADLLAFVGENTH
ncbi:alpha/beta fold hydrolase [Catenulispora pinisilvae]|uniref:alpha/beta fold hydrolase n=1 Tax=Catenulispora pinisilvae TaxID=2705253 RepID=UPI0018921685|nr:alpha/beta hydrolase [Catenulispora pinisilvae]